MATVICNLDIKATYWRLCNRNVIKRRVSVEHATSVDVYTVAVAVVAALDGLYNAGGIRVVM